MAGDLLPYFKMFPAETLADERFQGWTLEERGAWLSLLLHAWVNGSIPAHPGEIARVLHLGSRSFRRIWERINDRFIAHPDLNDRLTSRRLEIERDEARARANAGRAAATSRWNKDQPDATALRPQCERNAEPVRHAMPFSAAQRSAEEAGDLTPNSTPPQSEQTPAAGGGETTAPEPPASPPPPTEPAWDRVAAVWTKVCVPAGYGKPRRSAGLVDAAARLVRDAEWFPAFEAACAFLATSSFHRDWGATLGWVLEKRNRADKLAERGAAKPNGSVNGRSDGETELRRALAEAERDTTAGGPPPGDGRDGSGIRGSPPLDPPADGVASFVSSLPASFRAAVVHRREAREL